MPFQFAVQTMGLSSVMVTLYVQLLFMDLSGSAKGMLCCQSGDESTVPVPLLNPKTLTRNRFTSVRLESRVLPVNFSALDGRISYCQGFKSSYWKSSEDAPQLSTSCAYISQVANTKDSSSQANVLAAFGGCFLASFAFVFPCLRQKKKIDTKDFPSKATSDSMTASLGESSFGCSSSTTNSSASHTPLRRVLGGRTFTFFELSKATKKFSPSSKIGQGSFGTVYQGKLQDGTIVAIKRAKKNLYDARLCTEFDNEVEMLLTIDHLNLVKLIGYLDEGDERILVVEYVPNGNLREHLDGVHGVHLDLPTRLEICIDVAHALTYLHMYAGKPIIHRDVKTSNILLTERFRAKVADFGYARMGPIELGETHVSTGVKGTTGYLDPEYLKTFQLTEKSDVYSFGIVLIEIITGRRPIDERKEMKERVAIRWAFRKFLDGNVMDILDPSLEKSKAAGMVVTRIAELAFKCAAPTKQDRPAMKEAAEALWDIRKDYRNFTHSHEAVEMKTSTCRLSQDTT